MTCIAFVLVSWKPDAPAGMERAVAAAVAGLSAAGHAGVIVTSSRDTPSLYAGCPVRTLTSLTIPRPCGDDDLRGAIDAAAPQLAAELDRIFTADRVDAVVYVDGLWGLGRAMPDTDRVRRVLAVHVIGHDIDMAEALARADVVIAPSRFVLDQAAARGYPVDGWWVVPNALLTDDPPPSILRRRWLREHGPVRVLSRLGAEKGVLELLAAVSGAAVTRPVDIRLAAAGFEASPDSQQQLLRACRTLAERCGATLDRGLPWTQVPGWLAGAAVVIVPSLRETFGLVAQEAMSVGVPVVAYGVDNLPALLGGGGVCVPPEQGALGLWRAAGELIDDPVRYEHTSRAGYTLSRDYRPAHIADLLLKVVS